ncbi:hypothetical protein V2J09_000269 [Rumex salicifolius]
MLETEMHDLSDDADYAASQEQGSRSMTRSDSGIRSEPEGAELVYVKENVSVHPTQYMSERISGRLKLLKQGDALFMSWIPYKGQNSNTRLSEKDRNLYTIRLLPFTDIRSIRRHTPAFGLQYVIVVLASGLAFPPLYFYNGGLKELLATIKQHVSLVRSAEDANVFVINDFRDPLQRTLSSLELPGVASVANTPSTSFLASELPLAENRGSLDTYATSSSARRSRNKTHDPAKDLSINVLEKFSLVTKFARNTTSQLFREGSSENIFANGRRRNNQYGQDYLPEVISTGVQKVDYSDDHSLENSSNYLQEVSEVAPVPADPLEFEKLVLVWGKPRQSPLMHEEWTTFLDAEGRIRDPMALKKRIFYGGVADELRKEVWPFLLGYYEYDTTYAEREYIRSIKKKEFETLKRQWQSISPEQAKRFTKFRERKGLIEKDVGMSDFLSPILYVMQDDSEAFWCFTSLLERLGPNFNRDQNGMHAQLFALSKLVELLDVPLHNYFKQNDCLNYFFCFRELKYSETMRMWEVLWTHHLSEHLHLYVCVALLKRYRRKIIGEQMDFDTLLKFINELSGHIDIEATLKDAEALCICAGENGAACIPPGTPPSLPLDNGLQQSQLEDEVL